MQDQNTRPKICFEPKRHICKYLSLAAALLSISLPTSLWAQLSGIPRVVTLQNGAQFEGEVFSVPSVGGLDPHPTNVKRVVAIDDGMRLIFVAEKRVAPPLGDSLQDNTAIPIWQRVYPGDTEGYGHITAFGPFDEHGHRTLTVYDGTRTTTFIQGITEVTPRHCEVKTLTIPSTIPGYDQPMRDWTMRVGTNSIPVNVLRSVLRSQIKDYESPSEHLQIAEFFLKAGRFQQAINELRLIQRLSPDLSEEIESRRESVRQSYARVSILREIRLRLESGQTDYALQLAQAFDKTGIAGEILAEFRDIENEIQNKKTVIEQTRLAIGGLVSEAVQANVLDAQQAAVANRFQQELETELNMSNLSRLDAYQQLANDPAMKLDRKISIAISGWLTGSTNAIDNLAVVLSMYPVRDIAMEYLSTHDENRRNQLLTQLQEYEAGAPEFLGNIIANMKPPLAPDLSEYTGEKPIEFDVEIPGTKANPEPRKFKCLAHVPPQYDPYRRYPCIITLRAGVVTETQLNRWCGDFNDKLKVRTGRAMRHGFIVVAVDWKQEGQSVYTYSLREHAIVLKALRESLRMFSIDSDRVFLHGHDVGATAAYDIGISHPEHWAGIVGIGGVIDQFTNNYSKNTHVSLPVYCVVGQKDKASRDLSKRAWDEWCVTDHYVDCVVVMYKGRCNVSYAGGPTAEIFVEEEPEILKWASAQRRRRPDKSGFEFDCKVLRPWDNYFWFWKLHDIPEDNITRPEDWTFNNHNPLTISGQLKENVPNRFILGPSNLGSGGTLSLSPEFVNFDERIQVMGRGDFNDYVTPSSKVLLEDVRTRGDRQHPYWAKLECQGKRWSIAGAE